MNKLTNLVSLRLVENELREIPGFLFSLPKLEILNYLYNPVHKFINSEGKRIKVVHNDGIL